MFLFCHYWWSLILCNHWKSLKLDSHLPKNYFICFNESPSEMVKNAFYFILKALLVLKMFKFCVDFFAMYKNGLIREITLISKFMTSQPIDPEIYSIWFFRKGTGNSISIVFCLWFFKWKNVSHVIIY